MDAVVEAAAFDVGELILSFGDLPLPFAVNGSDVDAAAAAAALAEPSVAAAMPPMHSLSHTHRYLVREHTRPEFTTHTQAHASKRGRVIGVTASE